MSKVYDSSNDRMSQIRPELQLFARAMETKLLERDKEKGDTWKTSTDDFLWNRLLDEVEEYSNSWDRKELIDIANFAFFLWYNKDRSCFNIACAAQREDLCYAGEGIRACKHRVQEKEAREVQ